MKALANNFGVAEIEFRDWQEKGLVILNGVVSIDTENESYKAAEVLGITVPDMSIGRSAVTAVFLRSSKADGASTIVKSWIKDVRTICVERLPEFDEFGPLTLYFASAYVTLGQRMDCPLNTVLRPTIVNGTSGTRRPQTRRPSSPTTGATCTSVSTSSLERTIKMLSSARWMDCRRTST